jgi:hypothetical protein
VAGSRAGTGAGAPQMATEAGRTSVCIGEP